MQVPWPCAPHTAAKHRVLERYLQAWWPIMLSAFPRLTYVEGFAGPGVYTGGEPGSPIIALRTLRAAAAPDKPVDTIFIDRSRTCLDRLKVEIAQHIGPSARPLANPPRLVLGNAADQLLPQLDAVGAWDGGVFAFLDSWGNVAVPIDAVARLARYGCEVFVTLGRRFWQQFGKSLDPGWDRMFGSTRWREVSAVSGAPAQARFLMECYRVALRDAGFPYLLDFELVDDSGEHLYLIHATRSERGREKMKEAIWAVDPVSGAGFRDPRDVGEGQQALGLEWQPNIEPLKPLILDWLRGGPLPVDQVRRRVFRETIYKPVHASRAVEELVRAGLLRRDPPNGKLTATVVVARA